MHPRYYLAASGYDVILTFLRADKLQGMTFTFTAADTVIVAARAIVNDKLKADDLLAFFDKDEYKEVRVKVVSISGTNVTIEEALGFDGTHGVRGCNFDFDKLKFGPPDHSAATQDTACLKWKNETAEEYLVLFAHKDGKREGPFAMFCPRRLPSQHQPSPPRSHAPPFHAAARICCRPAIVHDAPELLVSLTPHPAHVSGCRQMLVAVHRHCEP